MANLLNEFRASKIRENVVDINLSVERYPSLRPTKDAGIPVNRLRNLAMEEEDAQAKTMTRQNVLLEDTRDLLSKTPLRS